MEIFSFSLELIEFNHPRDNLEELKLALEQKFGHNGSRDDELICFVVEKHI